MSWEENIRRVVPYTPGEQPKDKNVIKLNTNENPYPPSEAAMEALRSVPADAFRKYPDPNVTELRDEIAKFHGTAPERVFVGVGSDDVIAMLFQACFASEKPVLFPDVTYSFYEVWAELFKVPYETVPLKEDFTIDEEGFKRPNGGIIFPNPNAPTGILMGLDAVERIVRANPDSVVIVDEAYIDFGGESALPLIDRYGNLVVVRTFSKSRSMAGMRIGYCVGQEKLIGYLQAVKFSFNSYTMSVPAIKMGAAAVRDKEYFEDCCEKIISTRQYAAEEFSRLGFKQTDSRANFLFVRHPDIDAVELLSFLKSKGIYVRHFGAERIKDYLRVTVGTPEEMDGLFEAIKSFMGR